MTALDLPPEPWPPESWRAQDSGSRESAMLAHDIRSALNGVTGGIALVDRDRVDPDLRRQIERIAAAAESLALLLDEVLGELAGTPPVAAAVARPVAGVAGAPSVAAGARPGAAGVAAVDLRRLVRTLEHRWTGEAAAHGLALRIETGEALPDALRATPLDLLRVLGNLIGNAVKFSCTGPSTGPSTGTSTGTSTGPCTGTVRLTVGREPDGAVAFMLRDEGPGTGGDPERLFQYGFRSGGAAGQGIGLYIARTLAERMGGALGLADRPGGGLEAVLRLPGHLCIEARAAAPAGETAPDLSPEGAAPDLMPEGAEPDLAPHLAPEGAAPHLAPEGAAPDLAGVRVLLAEDNPTNRMVASQMLAALNAEVTLAGDGLEALAHFERARFDLVVVDIEMPRMSGLDVIRAIRARADPRARTPVVALTAYAMQEHRLRIAEAGADGLISKPIISTAAFGRTVAQHLRRPDPAAAAGDPAAEPVIDRAVFDALAETIGHEMMAELLDRIEADLAAARDALDAALDPIDRASILTNSHILISVAGAFGAARLRRRAAELNAAAHAAAHAGAGPELADGVRACLAEITPAMDFARAQRTAC